MQEARTDRRGFKPRLWGSCCVRSNVMRVGGILRDTRCVTVLLRLRAIAPTSNNRFASILPDV